MNYFVLYKVLLISKHCLAAETRGLGMEGASFLQVGERIGIAIYTGRCLSSGIVLVTLSNIQHATSSSEH